MDCKVDLINNEHLITSELSKGKTFELKIAEIIKFD